MRMLLPVILFSFAGIFSHAQDSGYKSEMIKELAEKAYAVSSGFGQRTLVTEFDEKGRMSNIGLDVIDLDMVDMLPRDVGAFIGRYFLELICWEKTTIQQKMYDDKVVFTIGDPFDVLKMGPDYAFSLECVDQREYHASWSVDGRTVLAFSFPVQYELILGMPQVEVEKLLEDEIKSYSPCSQDALIMESEKIGDGLYRSIPASSYYVESLNNCAYYIDGDDNEKHPVFSDRHPAESAANLFQTFTGHDYMIDVRQSVYGFQKLEYGVTVGQLVAYCRDHGMTAYFAVEKEDADYLQALLICENKNLAFNHMFSLLIPRNFISSPNAVFRANLNAYIPTHNLSELYQKRIEK